MSDRWQNEAWRYFIQSDPEDWDTFEVQNQLFDLVCTVKEKKEEENKWEF